MGKKLFLVCPDCHIENTLRTEFGDDSYFLTALGSVFDFSNPDSAEAINQFIRREQISEIVIVNDTHCTFINNSVREKDNVDTKAELELRRLQKNNLEKFDCLNEDEKKKVLAKLNIHRQAYELVDIRLMGDETINESVTLTGLVYNRGTSSFDRIALQE